MEFTGYVPIEETDDVNLAEVLPGNVELYDAAGNSLVLNEVNDCLPQHGHHLSASWVLNPDHVHNQERELELAERIDGVAVSSLVVVKGGLLRFWLYRQGESPGVAHLRVASIKVSKFEWVGALAH